MRVVLGLGSNLGDRARHLKRALVRLSRGPDALLSDARLARVYESPAMVPDAAPESWRRPYLNSAVAGATEAKPEEILRRAKALEVELGREPGERWAPRPVDIDFLWWDGGPVSRPGLVVPHPAVLERSFVLEPLRDLIPGEEIRGITVAEHARRRRRDEPAPAVWNEEAELRVRFPLLMGILNVTPDSFSDGGRFRDPDDALAGARALLDGGAHILDVGAESTRPGGEPVDPAEERRRLEPVLAGVEGLRRERAFRLSLDTRRPEVAAWGLERGVDLLNDVTGFRDPGMMAVAAATRAELVFMHSLSVPVRRGEHLPAGADPVDVVLRWTEERLQAFGAAGVDRRRLHLDPGVGFGMSAGQSWRVVDEAGRLHAGGLPLVVGHSRKSFLAARADRLPEDRDEATLEVSAALARKGMEVLRVHDPALHRRRFLELMGTTDQPWSP